MMKPPLSRRKLLNYAAQSAVVVGAAIPALKASGQKSAANLKVPEHRLKVVVAGGHPGDPEYGCGGTILRYTDLGHEVVLLYLNRGDWGFLKEPLKEPGSDRVEEARQACGILKARPLYASQLNGKAVVDQSHSKEFQTILEAEKPDVLITQWPIDGHADHRAIFALVYDAWLRSGKKAALYFYEVSNGEDTLMFVPTHYVDITSVESRKRSACFAHASQTPDRYYDLQSLVTRFRGIEIGCSHAEGFIRHIHSREDLLPISS
jgi:LmbE family N-acetylglucosaminyl deacetylase